MKMKQVVCSGQFSNVPLTLRISLSLKEVKEQTGHGLGCLPGLNCQRASDASEGSDSCISSDDEEDGVLEEGIDAEDLLAEPNDVMGCSQAGSVKVCHYSHCVS